MHKLAAKAASNAKPETKPYNLSDGGGLYLLVEPNGTKAWRFNYRFAGKQKTLALGVFPDISLKAAREIHKEARENLANDKDPSSQKKAMSAAKQNESNNKFEVVAREWAKTRGKKAVSTEKRQQALLEKDLLPYLGNRPIADISNQQLPSYSRRHGSSKAYPTSLLPSWRTSPS